MAGTYGSGTYGSGTYGTLATAAGAILRLGRRAGIGLTGVLRLGR